MKTVTFRAMGTDVQITIRADFNDDYMMNLAIERAKDRIADLEARLSRFQSDSEISQINRKPGHFVDIHEDTLKILQLAEQAYLRTNGVYNPCLGNVMEHIGYNVSFEKIGMDESPKPLVIAVPFIPPTKCPFELDMNHARVRLEPGYKIDLGGIAKGWIVEQAALEIEKAGYTQFLCNAGGDMVCRGKNGDLPWCVAIANPFASENDLLNLDVSSACVATSGIYRRKWSHDGQTSHHIIDPFLGRPVDTDIVSCTVICQSLVDAEITAKVGLILGSKTGLRWLKQQKTSGFVIVKSSGEVIHPWSS